MTGLLVHVLVLLYVLSTCTICTGSSGRSTEVLQRFLTSRGASLPGPAYSARAATQRTFASHNFEFKSGKAIEGTPRPKPTPVPSPTPVTPVPHRDPVPTHGPRALVKELGETCYSLRQSTYKYELCPFHNITQLSVGATTTWGAAPFYGILGLFRGWRIATAKLDQPPPLPTPKAEKHGGGRGTGLGSGSFNGEWPVPRWRSVDQLEAFANAARAAKATAGTSGIQQGTAQSRSPRNPPLLSAWWASMDLDDGTECSPDLRRSTTVHFVCSPPPPPEPASAPAPAPAIFTASASGGLEAGIGPLRGGSDDHSTGSAIVQNHLERWLGETVAGPSWDDCGD